MIYFVMFMYLLFCVIIYDVYERKRHFKFHYMALFLFFTLVAGLRWRLGEDTVIYMNDFTYDIPSLSQLTIENISESKYQPFWILLNAFCKSIGDFTFVQIFASTFLHAGVFCFFYRCCKKPFTALSIYYIYNYFYFSMQVTRESLAIACFLFGIMCLNKGALVKYYIWTLCAFMFHFFAFVLFILPLAFYASKKVVSLNKFIPIVILSFFAWINLKEVLITYAIDVVPAYLGNKLISYLLTERYAGNLWRTSGLAYNLFPLFIVFVFLFLSKKWKLKNLFNMKKNIWIGCILLYAILCILCLDMAILYRVSNYLYLVITILYSSCIYAIRFIQKSQQAMFVTCCLFCMLGLKVYMYTRPERIFLDYKLRIHNYAEYYPYTSIFDKNEPLERTILYSYK